MEVIKIQASGDECPLTILKEKDSEMSSEVESLAAPCVPAPEGCPA